MTVGSLAVQGAVHYFLKEASFKKFVTEKRIPISSPLKLTEKSVLSQYIDISDIICFFSLRKPADHGNDLF